VSGSETIGSARRPAGRVGRCGDSSADLPLARLPGSTASVVLPCLVGLPHARWPESSTDLAVAFRRIDLVQVCREAWSALVHMSRGQDAELAVSAATSTSSPSASSSGVWLWASPVRKGCRRQAVAGISRPGRRLAMISGPLAGRGDRRRRLPAPASLIPMPAWAGRSDETLRAARRVDGEVVAAGRV
jgi:hypothetical protein